MATLCLQKKEVLAEKVQAFPVLYNKRMKGFKEKTCMFSKRLGEIGEKSRFTENGYFIEASSNWEYSEDNSFEKIGALFWVRNYYKLLANKFDF